eukprot:7376285-Prymnesium_polylepis.1
MRAAAFNLHLPPSTPPPMPRPGITTSASARRTRTTCRCWPGGRRRCAAAMARASGRCSSGQMASTRRASRQ